MQRVLHRLRGAFQQTRLGLLGLGRVGAAQLGQELAGDVVVRHAEAGEKLTDNRVWMKADGTMPDDPVMHVAAMCYASDTTVLDSIITTHGLSWGMDRLFAATVNHSMWFHREFRFDDWLLYTTDSPWAGHARGFNRGRIFTADGRLVASVAQEGLMRHRPDATAVRA